MEKLECVKLILEIITAFSTAWIVIIHLFEKKLIKKFFTRTVPLFFCGIVTSDSKRVRGFKALKEGRKQWERTQNIIKTIAPDYKDEEMLVLNKEELFNLLYNSNVFTKIRLRK